MVMSNQKFSKEFVYAPSQPWDGVTNKNGGLANNGVIEIPGYANQWVSSDSPFIVLGNPSSNDVAFQYIVKNGTTVLFQSDLIAPAQKVDLNLYQLLDQGEYDINFEITTYDMKTQKAYNGASLRVKLVVN